MSIEQIDQWSEHRVQRTIRWMESRRSDTELLDSEEHIGEFAAEPERMPEYERAAGRRGLFVHYVGSRVLGLEGAVPLFYILLSRRERLTREEIRAVIPGLDPIHGGEGISVGYAA